MYDELFQVPAVVARYRTGPYAESREQFLKKAQADGYSPLTLERMAWALLLVGEIVRDAGGSIMLKRLRSALLRKVKSKWPGHPPSPHTIKLILQTGVPWLRSIGALIVEPERPRRFATELLAFKEYARVEQGLSPVTIASCDEAIRWFFDSLPSRVRSLDAVTIVHVDTFLMATRTRDGAVSRYTDWAVDCAVFSATPRAEDGVDLISRAALNCRVSMHSKMFRGRRALNRSAGFLKTPRPAMIQ